MIKRNFKIILIFSSVCFLGAFLVYMTDNMCDALIYYDWDVQFGIGNLIIGIFKISLLLILGLALFFLLRKFIPKNKYTRFKLIYFALLPLFAFYKQFMLIPENISNRKITDSICYKSSTNGMETKSVHIDYTEYHYIKNQLFLLPIIPTTSKNIDITYYHDSFLGDYNLDVKIEVPMSDIDTLNYRWTILKVDSLHKIKVMSFNDNRS